MRRAISPSQAWRSPFHPSCLPPSMRVAIACRTSFRPNNESSRFPEKRLPQRSHQSHRWNRYRPRYASATAAIAYPLWRGCPIIAVGQAFLNQLGQAGITRESVTSVRFPYRQSSAAPNLDGPLRRSDHAAPLQSACWSCARHSFVPAKSRSAAARNNGRGQVGTLLRVLLQKAQRTAHASSSARCFKCHGRSSTAGRSHTQGRPIVSLHRRSIVLVGMARHHVC
jgi:hypothetical protein